MRCAGCPDFYPRSPCGERPTAIRVPVRRFLFLSTLSLRRATLPRCQMLSTQAISIHALLAESDFMLLTSFLSLGEFLSTLSLRRATPHVRRLPPHRAISIHALLAESDPGHPAPCRSAPSISIHALLAESDELLQAAAAHPVDFYPRSPCGERQLGSYSSVTHDIFLSTLSLRRATPLFFLPPPFPDISIHALLAESDPCQPGAAGRHGGISIHALLAESDPGNIVSVTDARDFYPRSPCGERQLAARDDSIMFVFLSTLSLRRATTPVMGLPHLPQFLSTLSLRRATC